VNTKGAPMDGQETAKTWARNSKDMGKKQQRHGQETAKTLPMTI